MTMKFVQCRWTLVPLFVLAIVLPALGQTYGGHYPERPIRLVVPFTPGGGSDIVARAVAKKLSDVLDERVIVENRPGAGTIIGTGIVAKAPPDGYTLLFASSSFAINPALRKTLPYDTLKDFAPISLVALFPYVVVVSPKSPFDSLHGLVASATKSPGKLNIAVPGNGDYLAESLFNLAADIHVVSIRYKGAAPASIALMGNRVDYMFGSIMSMLPKVKAGQLKPLAVTSPERAPTLPMVPTIAESGYSGFSGQGWSGFVAPQGTPQPIIDKLSRAVITVMHDPDVIKLLDTKGAITEGSSPEKMRAFIRSEIAKWKRVVKEAKIKQL